MCQRSLKLSLSRPRPLLALRNVVVGKRRLESALRVARERFPALDFDVLSHINAYACVYEDGQLCVAEHGR